MKEFIFKEPLLKLLLLLVGSQLLDLKSVNSIFGEIAGPKKFGFINQKRFTHLILFGIRDIQLMHYAFSLENKVLVQV
jgi:hypothetical protein